MFVTVNRNRHMNLRLALEIRRVGAAGTPTLTIAPHRARTRAGEEIEDAVFTIIPAHLDEALHPLIGWDNGEIEHECYRIIAWRLSPTTKPQPVTSTRGVEVQAENDDLDPASRWSV